MVQAIRREGLHARGRQYVHLSADVETAQEVGRRKDPRPVLLVVDTVTAAEAGVVFLRGNDVVWLAAAVPPQHVRLLGPEPEPPSRPT